jgi:NAD(P)-dependent dehydrogenase (short-subunit alcohol dehydrogenase family)
MLRRLWRGLKVWRRVGLGPVSLLFRFDRNVRISPGTLRLDRHHPLHRRTGRNSRNAPAGASLPAGPHSAHRPCAVIVGVGPGVGYALAHLLATEGWDLILVSRDADRLQSLVVELHALGVSVESYGADATDESDVAELFVHVNQVHGVPALVVYCVQHFSPGFAVDVETAAFETAWRHNCLGAFLVARAAAQAMVPGGSGTIVLVGSTSSIIGRAGHLNLAVGKFGQRALAQVLARELWPRGIHVAHAIIDADVAEDHDTLEAAPQSDPHHIASAILHLHQQPRTAWTSELDLRPWNEAFWEHC